MLSLSDYIAKDFTVNGTKSNRIILFDVDDTLIHTTAQIRIMKRGKFMKKISNAEYNEYKLGPGEEFDYVEFSDPDILDHEEFTKYWDTLKREYRKGTHVGIITARGDCDLIYNFFKKKGIEIKRELIFAINDSKMKLTGSIAERKATVISQLVWLGYRTFIFFDDNETNLKTAKQIGKKYNVKMVTVRV